MKAKRKQRLAARFRFLLSEDPNLGLTNLKRTLCGLRAVFSRTTMTNPKRFSEVEQQTLIAYLPLWPVRWTDKLVIALKKKKNTVSLSEPAIVFSHQRSR